jgi:hypothetical protein
MPTVRPPRRTIESAPLPVVSPTPRLDQSGFGALAEGFHQASQATLDLYSAERAKADDKAVNDAISEGQKAIDDGVLKVRSATGDQASAASGDAYKAIDETNDFISGRMLTSDAQREKYSRRFQAMREAARLQIESHVGDQNRVAQNQSLEGRKSVQSNGAGNLAYALSETDPARADAAGKAAAPLGDLIGDIRKQRAAQGVPAPAIEAEVNDLKSTVYTNVLRRLIADKAVDRAATFLEANRQFVKNEEFAGQIAELAQRRDAFKVAEDAVGAGLEASKAKGGGALVVDREAAGSKFEELLKGKAPELQRTAREQFKARLAEVDEERKNKTSQVFAVALQALNRPGADGQPNMRIASIPPEAKTYLSNPANGREAAELWDALQRKVESFQMHGRSLAEKPTQANWEAYGALVKDMQDNPGRYRALDGDRFTSEVYGKVGPLIDKAMTLYKSVTDPKPDPRHLTGDEQKAVLEALPPDYRPSKFTTPGSAQAQVWDLVQERIGERKAAEWGDKPGAVPQALLKSWVAEEWASGTVKGGRYWGFVDASRVPKAVAPVKYPGKTWTPDAAAPGGTPNDSTKPILLNADGSYSTERTITIEADGKHLVIPTIIDGKQLSDDAAIKAWREGKNKPVGTFTTAKEANAYAQQRHLVEQSSRADEARIQAEWKRRFPGRKPLTPDQVQRALVAEKGAK